MPQRFDLVCFSGDDERVIEFSESEIFAYPIGENVFYLDGFPYGEKSVIIELKEGRLVCNQFGRQFYASKIRGDISN